MNVKCPGCKTTYDIPDFAPNTDVTVVCDNDQCEGQFDIIQKKFLFIPYKSIVQRSV